MNVYIEDIACTTALSTLKKGGVIGSVVSNEPNHSTFYIRLTTKPFQVFQKNAHPTFFGRNWAMPTMNVLMYISLEAFVLIWYLFEANKLILMRIHRTIYEYIL